MRDHWFKTSGMQEKGGISSTYKEEAMGFPTFIYMKKGSDDCFNRVKHDSLSF